MHRAVADEAHEAENGDGGQDDIGAQQRRDAAFAAMTRNFDGLASLEPELLRSIAPSTINNLKHVTGHARGLQFAAWRKLLQSLNQTYNRMIFVPSLESARAWKSRLRCA